MEAMVGVLVHAPSSLCSRDQQACTSDSHALKSAARRLLLSRQAKQAADLFLGNHDTRPTRVLVPPSPASQTGNSYRAARAAISVRARSVSTQLKSTSACSKRPGERSAISATAPSQ